MATFSNANYSGPFSSKYEEAEALSGERGNQAAYMASQAAHSRGLTGRGRTDTSRFGTNRDVFGNDQFATAQANPLNYAMSPPQPALQGGQQVPMGGAFSAPRKVPMSSSGSGGFLPGVFGSGNPQARPANQTGIGRFFNDLTSAYRGSRADMGMGIGNLLSGGAFSSDPSRKMQGLLNMGYSPSAASDYIQRTQNTLDQQKLQRALYGGDREGGGGDFAIEEVDIDPIEEDEDDDRPPIFIAPIRRGSGGIVSLRRR